MIGQASHKHGLSTELSEKAIYKKYNMRPAV